MDKTLAAQLIAQGNAYMGIEFGSTRIKSVLINEQGEPLASGSHGWENRYEDGIWTYSLEDVWDGIRDSFQDLKKDVRNVYGVEFTRVASIGISAMMHGYMVFDKEGELLVPFRTWRNNITGEASRVLTDRFQFPIPQRWSIAHLYQAILNGEEHLPRIDFMTTLEGYVQWKLTGKKVLGIGEASGMFPIDMSIRGFDRDKIAIFEELIADKKLPWKLSDILPEPLMAGEEAGCLTEEGAKLLDPNGGIEAGIPLCPPEGDVDTGMVATNCLTPGHAHVSAGTSCFANVVMASLVDKLYPEIEEAVTPAGTILAMVHSNNCTTELDAWVGLFKEFADAIGADADMGTVYSALYRKSLEADPEAGGLLAYGYHSGEHITGFESGRPLVARSSRSRMNLANFMRAEIYTSIGALKVGLDVLKGAKVPITHVMVQGGLFKTKEVGQRALAAAMDTEVSVMATAGEGGSWGMALLALYMVKKAPGQDLQSFLNETVFNNADLFTVKPTQEEVDGFNEFTERYKKGLVIERSAVDSDVWTE